jgi:hypothetical protein
MFYSMNLESLFLLTEVVYITYKMTKVQSRSTRNSKKNKINIYIKNTKELRKATNHTKATQSNNRKGKGKRTKNGQPQNIILKKNQTHPDTTPDLTLLNHHKRGCALLFIFQLNCTKIIYLL